MSEHPQNKICCLTLTGDRPLTFDLARLYFERSEKPCPVDWVVVDDGHAPLNPGGCIYHRRAPDGDASLPRQFLFAVERLEHYDVILILEDDDYYHPRRIADQISWMNAGGLDVHGWMNTVYYNVPGHRWILNCNRSHASFFETAMTLKAAQALAVELRRNKGIGFWLDMALWRLQGLKMQLTENTYRCVGMKGLPGRSGLGMGHNINSFGYTDDRSGEKLRALLGAEDAKRYAAFQRL